jgi:hypothetical protein
VRHRLSLRGEPSDDPRWAWVHRRAAECCEAHVETSFSVHVPTAHSLPEEVAATIANRVQTAA